MRNGKYFIVITDEKDQSGKYSLAIGTIEDFSVIDFVTILPKAWLDTKLFVNDYLSIMGLFFATAATLSIPVLIIIKKRRRTRSKKNNTIYKTINCSIGFCSKLWNGCTFKQFRFKRN